jgi:aspartate-semialdehyde dehydrogenase
MTRAPKFSLVGGETLLGHDLEEVLRNRATGAVITAYASSGEGTFGEEDGEAVYQEALEAHSIAHDRAVIVAGSKAGALKAYQLVKDAGGHPVLIDCTGHLDHQPEARIVAPLVEPVGKEAGWLQIVAHPASSAIALTLTRLGRYKPIRQAVVTIFEPASELGKRGASELHQQTTSLLSFKTLDKKVFDAQLAFNLLPAYGEEAPDKLAAAEQRIERHLATLLSRQPGDVSITMPSLRLIQAPVFHGYSISVWVEFDANVEASALGEALASAQIEVRGSDEETPTSVESAGQSGLMAGDIRVDRNNPHAAWLWLVADNLRLTADAVGDLVNQGQGSIQ